MINQVEIMSLKTAQSGAANMAKSAKTMERQAAEIAGGLQRRMESGETIERGELSLQIEDKKSSPRVSWKDVACILRGEQLGHSLTTPEVKTWTERLLMGIAPVTRQILRVIG